MFNHKQITSGVPNYNVKLEIIIKNNTINSSYMYTS